MSGVLKITHFPRLASARGLKTSAAIRSGHGIRLHNWWDPERCGNRETVGYGINGKPAYDDRVDFWFPSVRFRANDATITPIREKELGDWNKLSLAEKKLLYRYSFCQTLSEFEAPNHYWKLDWAIVLAVTSVSLFYMCFMQKFFYHNVTDPCSDNEYKESMAERLVVMDKGKFLGPARYYDYEKNRWKD